MIIGRWWKDETVEVDVLGMRDDRTALVGECRWQTGRLTSRDISDLQRKVAFVPQPSDDVRLAFWTRSGAKDPGFGPLTYSAPDVVG